MTFKLTGLVVSIYSECRYVKKRKLYVTHNTDSYVSG